MSAQQEIDQPVLSRRELLGAFVVAGVDLISPSSRLISERDIVNYHLAADIMRQFVDISSRPAIRELYDAILKDSAGHIGIADNLGYKKAYYNEGFTYLIFPEDFDPSMPSESLEQYPWSIKILVRDVGGKPVRAKVAVQTNAFGDFYTGVNDILPSEENADFADLALFSNYIFNLPDGIRGSIWEIGEDLPTNIKREYQSEGGSFKEVLTIGGIVSFEAPFPIPNDLDKSSENNYNGYGSSHVLQG